MSDAVVNVLREWGVLEVIGTVWDTTSSNTGVHIGAVTVFEQFLGRAFLWLACRHHVAERHMTHPYDALIPPKGPDDALFLRFKTWFISQIQEHDRHEMPFPAPGLLRKFAWPADAGNDTGPYCFLTSLAKDTLEWAEMHLAKGTFPREDYRELAELIVVYLGGTVVRPRDPGYVFYMRKPGALHRARFMAKGIYILKIAMLSFPFDLSVKQENDMMRLAQFVAVLYGRYFLTSSLATAAPRHDLEFWYRV